MIPNYPPVFHQVWDSCYLTYTSPLHMGRLPATVSFIADIPELMAILRSRSSCPFRRSHSPGLNHILRLSQTAAHLPCIGISLTAKPLKEEHCKHCLATLPGLGLVLKGEKNAALWEGGSLNAGLLAPIPPQGYRIALLVRVSMCGYR